MSNDKNNERIYCNMVLFYNEMNNKPGAEKALAKTVDWEFQNPKVYSNYGLMLNVFQKYKEPEADLQKGIAIKPAGPDLSYALSLIYIQTGNKAKALQTALRLKQLDPINANYQELFNNLHCI